MEWLFSWEVTSVVVGTIVAIGFGFAWECEVKPAKICFLLAAADAMGGIAMWGAKSAGSTWLTTLGVVCGCGLVGFLVLQSFRYVDHKEEKKKSAQSNEKLSQV